MSSYASSPETWHGTTILTVRKDGKVVIAGDGQVSLGQTILKGTAKKTPSPCSSGSRPSSSASPTSSSGLASSLPRTGAPTAICAGSKP